MSPFAAALKAQQVLASGYLSSKESGIAAPSMSPEREPCDIASYRLTVMADAICDVITMCPVGPTTAPVVVHRVLRIGIHLRPQIGPVSNTVSPVQTRIWGLIPVS